MTLNPDVVRARCGDIEDARVHEILCEHLGDLRHGARRRPAGRSTNGIGSRGSARISQNGKFYGFDDSYIPPDRVAEMATIALPEGRPPPARPQDDDGNIVGRRAPRVQLRARNDGVNRLAMRDAGRSVYDPSDQGFRPVVWNGRAQNSVASRRSWPAR